MSAAPRIVSLVGSPAIDGLVARHFEPDRDYGGVAELLVAANLNDGVDWLPTAEALRHDWSHASGLDISADVLVAEAAGQAVGFAEHSWRIRGGKVFHHLAVVVRPDVRHRGLGRALLAWAEDRVRRSLDAGTAGRIDLPHTLAGWADLEIPEVAPFAAAAGYHVDGYGVMMTRSLVDPIAEVGLPQGLEIRPVRPEDHRQIWDADTEAFQDHRDPWVRTESDFTRWFTQPDLNTSLWLVAWDGDQVAGSVMNFVFRDENERLSVERGWLEHVSVRRAWRNRGLASALISRSMRILRDLALDEVALGADAENLSGAVRLYESLGFRRVRTSAGYRKAIEVPEAR